MINGVINENLDRLTIGEPLAMMKYLHRRKNWLTFATH
jgi:hypothetical protein